MIKSSYHYSACSINFSETLTSRDKRAFLSFCSYHTLGKNVLMKARQQRSRIVFTCRVGNIVVAPRQWQQREHACDLHYQDHSAATLLGYLELLAEEDDCCLGMISSCGRIWRHPHVLWWGRYCQSEGRGARQRLSSDIICMCRSTATGRV